MNFRGILRRARSTFLERGFDFEFASLIFESPTLERMDRRED
jgi:hypothetical protein